MHSVNLAYYQSSIVIVKLRTKGIENFRNSSHAAYLNVLVTDPKCLDLSVHNRNSDIKRNVNIHLVMLFRPPVVIYGFRGEVRLHNGVSMIFCHVAS